MLLERIPLLSSPSLLFFLNKVLAILNWFCKVQISTVQHFLTEVGVLGFLGDNYLPLSTLRGSPCILFCSLDEE